LARTAGRRFREHRAVTDAPEDGVSLLLVEDDRELTGLLERVLTDEGYTVTTAADGHHGLHLGLTRTFEVMIIDRGLPAIEGLDLIGRLRGKGVLTPMLVLSARGSAHERVEGLDAGAEDYLAKPFDLAELIARLRALTRRQRIGPPVLSLGNRSLDVAARTVRGPRDDDEVELSERETALLAVLATRPHQVFTRRDLLDRVFSDAESETVVDTYVHYCRRKLGRDIIRTVRGLGYRLGKP
jgi:two-component system response regulator QseB